MIKNLNEIMEAKKYQMEQTSQKPEDNFNTVLKDLFGYLKQTNERQLELINIVIDNQNMVSTKLDKLINQLEGK